MRLGWTTVAPALALVLLMALPVPTLFAGSGSVHVVSAGSTPALLPATSSSIPAALQQPWAARAGFDPTLPEEVREPSAVTGDLIVALTFWPSNDALFQSPGAGASPLSPLQVAGQFGLTEAQYNAVEQYFLGHGVQILHEWPDRLALTVQGPAAAVDSAFATQVVQGSLGGRTVEFPASAPSLPAPFSSEVAAVSGLSTAETGFQLPFLRDPAPSAEPSQGRTTSTINPNALHVAYGLNDLYNYSGTDHFATGVGIAVILWGSGYDPSDIAQYFSSVYPSEFPAVAVRPFPIDNAPAPNATALSDPSNSTEEMSLDIEWAGTAAPGATIDAVYAPDGPASDGYSPADSTMEDAIHAAVSQIPGVSVISMSFGSLDGQDPSFQAALSVSFATAGVEKITLLAASGDTGGDTRDGCQGGAAPQFPAASPYVLAVGGTTPILSQDPFGAITGIESESAWTLSGGGFSSDYTAPVWEKVGSAAAPIRASGGYRGMPDVAGPANQNIYYYDGRVAFGSGTSFATPLWAGLVAEMDAVRGSPLGFITPRIYAVGAQEPNGTSGGGLADITSGGNCVAPAGAGPGWDAATGWGSPRALALFEHLAGTFVMVNLSATPSPVAPGGDLHVAVEVLNQTSERPISNLPVEIDLSGSSCTSSGTLALSNATTDSSGSGGAMLQVPACYIGNSVSVTVVVAADGYYGGNSTNVAVNLLGLSSLLRLAGVYPYSVVTFVVIMAAATAVGLYLGRRRHHRDGPAASAGPAAGGAPGPSPPGPLAAPPKSAPPPEPPGGVWPPQLSEEKPEVPISGPPAAPPESNGPKVAGPDEPTEDKPAGLPPPNFGSEGQ
jgi:kumamolisin